MEIRTHKKILKWTVGNQTKNVPSSRDSPQRVNDSSYLATLVMVIRAWTLSKLWFVSERMSNIWATASICGESMMSIIACIDIPHRDIWTGIDFIIQILRPHVQLRRLICLHSSTMYRQLFTPDLLVRNNKN